MKNLLYFMVGLVYLPFYLVIKAVIYIKDLGDTIISNYNFMRMVNKKRDWVLTRALSFIFFARRKHLLLWKINSIFYKLKGENKNDEF